jgi:alkylation response protein AidB-like acyl-CoA dehydrogenase
MRFAFTDDQLLFRDAVREFLAKEYPAESLRAAWDDDLGCDPGRWRALADLGVVGSTAPEALGGLGLRDVDLVPLFEELGRAAFAPPVLETTAVVVPLLSSLAADGRARAALDAIVSGEAVATVGFDDDLVLAADIASLIVRLTKDRVTLHTTDELDLIRQPSIDGARHLFRVTYPSEGDVLASGNDVATMHELAWRRGALGAAAQLIGLGDHMLELTVGYVQERKQFGMPIGSFQALKHHLADALLAVDFARPVVQNAAYSLTHELPTAARDVSAAKAAASEAATHVARTALQCHGAIAYTVEYDLHLWMKRAWALAAAWGDARSHRARVAEHVLGPSEAH